MSNIEKLYEAVSDGDISKVLLLLEEDGGASINSANKDGESLLHLAARAGHSRIASVLIKNGADLSAEDVYDRTPLDLAIVRGKDTIVQMFIECNADLNAPNSDGRRPLDTAVAWGRMEIAQILREHGACLSDEQNLGAQTPSSLPAVEDASAIGAMPSTGNRQDIASQISHISCIYQLSLDLNPTAEDISHALLHHDPESFANARSLSNLTADEMLPNNAENVVDATFLGNITAEDIDNMFEPILEMPRLAVFHTPSHNI